MSKLHDDLITEAAKHQNPEPVKPADETLAAQLAELEILAKDDEDTSVTASALKVLVRAKEGAELRALAACYAHTAAIRIHAEKRFAETGGKRDEQKVMLLLEAESLDLLGLWEEAKKA